MTDWHPQNTIKVIFLGPEEFLHPSKYLYYTLEVGKHKKKSTKQQYQSTSGPITMKNCVDNQNGINKYYENQ